MKQVHRLAIGAMALAGAITAAPAAATVLVFGSDSCGGPASCADFSVISQSFGDTATVNVAYRSVAAPGNSAAVPTRPLRFSEGGISGSNGAFVVPNGATPNQHAEIRIEPTDLGSITLNSVDFGTYFGTSDTLGWFVYDTSWSLLGSGTVALDPGALARVLLNITSSSGLVLQFGAASVGGGIQNINYSFNTPPPAPPPSVPEPASWAMLLAGFGLIGTTRRFRERRRTLV